MWAVVRNALQALVQGSRQVVRWTGAQLAWLLQLARELVVRLLSWLREHLTITAIGAFGMVMIRVWPQITVTPATRTAASAQFPPIIVKNESPAPLHCVEIGCTVVKMPPVMEPGGPTISLGGFSLVRTKKVKILHKAEPVTVDCQRMTTLNLPRYPDGTVIGNLVTFESWVTGRLWRHRLATCFRQLSTAGSQEGQFVPDSCPENTDWDFDYEEEFGEKPPGNLDECGWAQ